MAAPKVVEVVQKVSDKILIYFDQPIDQDIVFPLTAFSINYGKIPLIAAGYYGTAAVLLVLDRELTHRDKVQVNYEPPDDVFLCIRGPVGEGASSTVIRRNVVRAFYKVPVKNLIRVDESTWDGNSNLGGGKRVTGIGIDRDDPEGDGWKNWVTVCGIVSDIRDPDSPAQIGDNLNPDPTDPPDTPTGGDGASGGDGGASGGSNYDAGAGVGTADSSAGGNGGAGGGSGGGSNSGSGGGTVGGGSVSATWSLLPYPNVSRPTPRAATPDDFVLAYGMREATQISNIDDADATSPNNEKIWMAIQDACALIDNYISVASRAGKLLISSSRRRTSLIIARYYLDTVRRREDVKADYESAISELERGRELRDMIRPDIPAWLDPCNPKRGNLVYSHRVPQYYNGVSGKGLDGWWVDSGADTQADFRTDGDNDQNNNDMGNHGNGYGSAGREPEQPVDDGGLEPGAGSN